MGNGAIWDGAIAISPSTRPAIYANFESAPVPRPVASADGVIFYAAVADWGPVATKVNITSPVEVNKYLGTNAASVPRRAILEALNQGAKTIQFYRLATGSAAASAVTLNDGAGTPAAALTITAKYPGLFGDTLKAAVVTNVANAGLRDVEIYEGTIKRETFTGADNDEIVADFAAKGSNYVVVAQAGTANRVPANIVAQPLTGGNSGSSVTSTEYVAALVAAQDALFSVLVTDTTDTAIQATIRTWVNDSRAGGNRVRAVVAAAAGLNYAGLTAQAQALNSEGVTYLANGYIKPDGIVRDAVEVGVSLAAAMAVQDTQSITRYVFPDVDDISKRFSSTEIGTGLVNGILFLTYDGSKVFVEQGLNTLQVGSQVAPKSKDWRKIRYIAIQDEFVQRASIKLGDNFIGKVSNDVRGRQEAVNQVQVVLDEMAQERLLLTGLDEDGVDQTPLAYLDPRYESDEDRVFVAVTGKAVDAIEKFFLTVVI